MKLKAYTLAIIFASSISAAAHNDGIKYIDPRIGSEGLGRTFIGPSSPFGMAKPGPDCTASNNAGWAPMPEQVNGFSQTHVSGTGGGPKYGNILIQPFCSGKSTSKPQKRTKEEIRLGYYRCVYRNGIETEITTSDRSSIYRITYPKDSTSSLLVDAGFFLGETPIPDAREAQQFVGSEVEITSTTEIRGYTRIRGGWNNGKAYTVYFWIETDKPFTAQQTWKGTHISSARSQFDSGEKTGAIVSFPNGTDQVNVRIGISFVSSLKARQNLQNEVKGKTFNEVHNDLIGKWSEAIGNAQIGTTESTKNKRMFYTALYHTMLMPVDRTGECPGWNDNAPYYDDYYAIWDTYRTSTPLLTLLCPERETAIVNSLLTIYKRDGYMPDARSGNSNGRTQGGSNAEIVIADAIAKGLKGIDYEMALKAMLKDATTPPGGNEEAEGRGALLPYLEKGYIPYGYPRAGTRTIEYAFCDWAIAKVAQQLGKEDIYKRYIKQSETWRNLWRKDYEHDGAKGFIMPRDNNGEWLDQLPFGHSRKQGTTFSYPPSTSYEGPWYVAWWDCFFYEASSWEYSLSIPHDIKTLIELCGGTDMFLKRLETFFKHGYYNVANEPSFLSPCLYHWIGRPDMSSDRVTDIINNNYDDTPTGIPGNDDGGAMSSWLAFHMMGLYPNAGHDYYLIHTPIVKEATVKLGNGRNFTIRATGLSTKHRYIVGASLNSKPYQWSTIKHEDIMKGGELTLTMGTKPTHWGEQMSMEEENTVAYRNCPIEALPQKKEMLDFTPTIQMNFSLHGQTRRFRIGIDRSNGVRIDWSIVRNLKTWRGAYVITQHALDNARQLNYEQPLDGNTTKLEDEYLFALVSKNVLLELKTNRQSKFNNTIFKLIGIEKNESGETLLHVKDNEEGAEMWIVDNEDMPLIWQMKNNPVEIDWKMEYIKK